MEAEIRGLSKRFNGQAVFENLNLALSSRQPVCLMSPSGAGKTTLLRILMGLETADQGSIQWTEGGRRLSSSSIRFSAVFQEDRLCEAFNPVENILMAAGRTLTREEAQAELSILLPPSCLSRPVRTFSGGMKRRTAICRALLAPSQVILMDEPFTGLDEENRRLAIRYILQKAGGRLLVVTTHLREDVGLLGGKLVGLGGQDASENNG